MLSRRCSCYPEKKNKQTNKQTQNERTPGRSSDKRGRMSPLLFSCSHCENAKRLKLLIRACHNESGCTVLVWARDHVDGYTVRNPKLISDHTKCMWFRNWWVARGQKPGESNFHVQWNPVNTDTKGTCHSVRITRVSVLGGL